MRQRGTLTLPIEVREKYGIQPGDTFRLTDLDGTLVLTPMMPRTPRPRLSLQPRPRRPARVISQRRAGRPADQRPGSDEKQQLRLEL